MSSKKLNILLILVLKTESAINLTENDIWQNPKFVDALSDYAK